MLLRLLLVASLLAVGVARADEPPPSSPEAARAKAKELYGQATTHFNLGRFKEAAEEYEQVFELFPDPALLYNIAQAYRLAGTDQKALFFYRSFLQRAPNTPSRGEVEGRIAVLQQRIAEQRNQAASRPRDQSGNNGVQQVKIVYIERPQAPTKPIYKRWWLWTAVGAVAVGGAVGLGVGLSQRPARFNTTLPDGGPGATMTASVSF